MTQQIIIHYVPDAAKDERIILGVVVFDDNSDAKLRAFTKNWKRVEAFAERDVQFLKELEKEDWEKETILKLCDDGSFSSIQFTSKGTVRPFQEAFEDAVKRYL